MNMAKRFHSIRSTCPSQQTCTLLPKGSDFLARSLIRLPIDGDKGLSNSPIRGQYPRSDGLCRPGTNALGVLHSQATQPRLLLSRMSFLSTPCRKLLTPLIESFAVKRSIQNWSGFIAPGEAWAALGQRRLSNATA